MTPDNFQDVCALALGIVYAIVEHRRRRYIPNWRRYASVLPFAIDFLFVHSNWLEFWLWLAGFGLNMWNLNTWQARHAAERFKAIENALSGGKNAP